MDTALTIAEAGQLVEQEAVIERGLKTFVDVGNALLTIRDGRLYRASHGTFEDYCRERWQLSKPYATQLIQASQVVGNLVAIATILPATESQARPLAQLEPAQQIEAWQAAVETAPDGKVTAAHVQAVVDAMREPEAPQAFWEPVADKPHVAFNSGNNEWYTPSEFIEAARGVMGGIDLDPASSELANRTVGAAMFYTSENDGLGHTWRGRVWMNPPYASELIGRFTEKLTGHFRAGDVSEAVVLVNNATETVWFQTMLEVASAVCFVKRRVKFIDMEGNATGAPLQGQAVLYMGSRPQSFADAFGPLGAVLYG